MGRPSIASREARPPLAYAATAVGLVAATALGFFARPDTPHLVIAALGLAVTGAKLFRVGTAGPLSRRDGLEVGLLLTTLGAILVQATGGLDSALRPVQYLLLALLAAQLELAVTVAMALLAGGLLAAPLLGTGLLAARSTTLLSETATLLVFAVVVGGFVRWERKSREEATRRLKRLTEETEALAQETDDIEGLKADSSPARRERERRLRELRNVLDAQVHRALETSRAALAAQGVVYYRLDGEKLTLLDAIAESDHLVESVDARAGFFAGAIKSRRPVTLPDVTGSGVPYYRKEAGVRSVMVVPLQQGDDVRGLLIADHKEADRFGKAHAEVLSGLGAMIGELEHGGRERERHQKFQDRLQQLVEVSRALQDSLAPEALAEKALAAAQELARFDFALVATEGGRDRFTISTAAGLDNGRLAGKDAPTGETLVGWVLRNRVYLNVPRFRSRSVKTPLLGRRLDPDGVRAALIFPMVRQEGEAVGAFVFGSTTRESFTADEFEMLELVVPRPPSPCPTRSSTGGWRSWRRPTD